MKLNSDVSSPLKGLFSGVEVPVIDIDMTDDKFTFRVKIDTTPATTPWLPKAAVALSDPFSLPPRPSEPTNCCGSECPDCVWITYWKDVEEWSETIKKKIITSNEYTFAK